MKNATTKKKKNIQKRNIWIVSGTKRIKPRKNKQKAKEKETSYVKIEKQFDFAFFTARLLIEFVVRKMRMNDPKEQKGFNQGVERRNPEIQRGKRKSWQEVRILSVISMAFQI